ncbi:MAG: ASKHA domain-containing protein [Negativicutes bacterium]|nr:ASKHA domain-containing protein [Negativicutes bacterium]
MVSILAIIDAVTSRKIIHQPGDNLLVTLRGAGLNIRTGCQYSGACGLCQILVRKGDAGPVTVTEKLQLGRKLKQGVRLACQVIPAGDLVVELMHQHDSVLPVSFLSELQSEYCSGGGPADRPDTGFAVSVDIGTTNVSMALFNLNNDQPLGSRTFSNPQCEYGVDVIARMLKAAENPVFSEDMRGKLFGKLGATLQELTATAGVATKDISSLGIVGNTAMLALFSRCFYQQLLDPEYWDKAFSFQDTDHQQIRGFLQLGRRAGVKIVDPLAGFVGSDLLAGITAIRLLDKEPGTLFLDFGTNTEIALWDGNTVWVTSAAGGPAFEGCGMSSGCPAVPGAVYQVRYSPETGSGFTVSTVDGREALGICGSGYVDIIAALLDMRLLDPIGRLPGKTAAAQEITITENPQLKVTKQDIDTLQRAKAAVAAGIRVLSQRAALSPQNLVKVYVAGNFGRFLDIQSAQRIGLLPDIDKSRIQLYPGAALRGCADILLHHGADEMLAKIRAKAVYCNLAFDADFESSFMESLYLRSY